MSDRPASLAQRPPGCAEWPAELKRRIDSAQQRATLAEYQLAAYLPPELQISLPSIEQTERELGGDDVGGEEEEA